MEVNNLQLDYYVSRLKNKEYFSFVRYGDGEWYALFKDKGVVSCGLQQLTPETKKMMNESLSRHSKEKNLLFGMQNYALRMMERKIQELLKENKLEHIKWVNTDVFHYASRDGKLFPLISELRKQKVIVIGPPLLKDLPKQTFAYIDFIQIPKKDCYLDKTVSTRILKCKEKYGDGIVYSFSCGIFSNVLILNLHKEMRSNFLIDFGSLWDVFCGKISRSYMKRMNYSDTLKRNLGLEK